MKTKIVSILGCLIAYFSFSMVIISPEEIGFFERIGFSMAIKGTLMSGNDGIRGVYKSINEIALYVAIAIAVSIFIEKIKTIKMLLPFFVVIAAIKWLIEIMLVASMVNEPTEIKYFVIIIFIVGIFMAYQSLKCAANMAYIEEDKLQ